MKLRSGQIEVIHRADALAMFTRLSVDSFTILLMSGLQFRTAARFADQHALGLRAGDVLPRLGDGQLVLLLLHVRGACGGLPVGGLRTVQRGLSGGNPCLGC